MFSNAESGILIAIYDGVGVIRDLRAGGWFASMTLFEEVGGVDVNLGLLTSNNGRINFLDPALEPKASLYIVFDTIHMSGYNFRYATGDLYISLGSENEPPIELGFIMRESRG
ncbi:MAG: hypothetical protein ACRDBG_26220 [Waterburya sp.]